jgi:hypothetical protein
LFSLAPGCAGAEDEDEAPVSSEDALTQIDVPGVTAIELETAGAVSSVGTVAKVKRVMAAMKTLKPSDPRPACDLRSPATKMRLFDKSGAVIASGSYVCTVGSLEVAARPGAAAKTIPVRVRSADVTGVTSEPLVPADLLYGITSINIMRRGEGAKSFTFTEAAAREQILSAMQVGKIDLNAPGTRCFPSHVITFRRDETLVGSASYTCDAAEALPASLTSSFVALDPKDQTGPVKLRGGVDLDPRIIKGILDAAQ